MWGCNVFCAGIIIMAQQYCWQPKWLGATNSSSILGLWFLRIIYKSPFASKFSWNKRSSHQGKKEVTYIVSKPLVSCLWGCGESVNPLKLNIQEVQVAFSSRPKEDPGPLLIFQDFWVMSYKHPCFLEYATLTWYIFVSCSIWCEQPSQFSAAGPMAQWAGHIFNKGRHC